VQEAERKEVKGDVKEGVKECRKGGEGRKGGVKEGVKEGVKKGVKEGLTELRKGGVKEAVKEGSKGRYEGRREGPPGMKTIRLGGRLMGLKKEVEPAIISVKTNSWREYGRKGVGAI
jgi:hypothetical protein